MNLLKDKIINEKKHDKNSNGFMEEKRVRKYAIKYTIIYYFKLSTKHTKKNECASKKNPIIFYLCGMDFIGNKRRIRERED